MPRVRWGIVPAVICALALGGCGSSDKTETTPHLTRVQRDALVAQLERARVTAAANDVEGTKVALDAFKRQVARLRRAGSLSDSAARSLRLGAARALARATSDSAPPAPTETQTTPAPAPTAPPAKKKDDKKKHEKGGGKHKGHGEGDD